MNDIEKEIQEKEKKRQEDWNNLFPMVLQNPEDLKVDFTSLHKCEHWDREDRGKFVAVRPCIDNPEDKTYLGLHLGSLPLSVSVVYNKKEGSLNIEESFYMPAMFVFALNKIVVGPESFWSIIDDPENLTQITDEKIDNVWYVKALEDISSAYDDDDLGGE